MNDDSPSSGRSYFDLSLPRALGSREEVLAVARELALHLRDHHALHDVRVLRADLIAAAVSRSRTTLSSDNLFEAGSQLKKPIVTSKYFAIERVFE